MIGSRLVLDGLAILARRSPRLAFAICDHLLTPVLYIRNRSRTARLRTLFPLLSGRAATEAERNLCAITLRANVVSKCLEESADRRMTQAMRSLVTPSAALRALRPPAILGLFHLGPLRAISVELEQMQGKVLGMRRAPMSSERPNVSEILAVGDEHRRGLAFRYALRHLREGGFVSMAFDSLRTASILVPFLGYTLRLAPGPFRLSRLAHAPIVPVVAQFRGMQMELLVGEPLQAGEGLGGSEWELAASVAEWLERYVIESPERLGLNLLDSVGGLWLSELRGGSREM